MFRGFEDRIFVCKELVRIEEQIMGRIAWLGNIGK